jgi:hypothetical protein
LRPFCLAKALATPCNSQGPNGSATLHRRHSYQKVLEGRKQPIRGLWLPSGKFIDRFVVELDPSRNQSGKGIRGEADWGNNQLNRHTMIQSRGKGLWSDRPRAPPNSVPDHFPCIMVVCHL